MGADEVQAAVAEGVVEAKPIRARDFPREPTFLDFPLERSPIRPLTVERREYSSEERLHLALSAIRRAVIDPERMEQDVRGEIGSERSVQFFDDLPDAPGTALIDRLDPRRHQAVEQLDSLLTRLGENSHE